MVNSTAASGRPATVITRARDVFVGRALVEDNWTHFVGRRRVGDGVDGTYWSKTVERSWSNQEIRVMRWIVTESDRVAA